MITNIKSDHIELTQDSILLSSIATKLYSDPLLFKVNVPLGVNPFKREEEVIISLLTNQQVTAYFMFVQNTIIQGQRSTTLIFANIEHVKIRFNQYPQGAVIFSIKMDAIIKNSDVQELLDWEMRKKGVIFKHENYILKTDTLDSCFNQDPQIIQDIDSVKIIDEIPSRHNYSTALPNEFKCTNKGFDYPRFIPLLSKSQIVALNKFIEPKLLITSSSLNLGIDIGTTVNYYNKIYTVIFKEVTSLRQEYIVSFRLGMLNV